MREEGCQKNDGERGRRVRGAPQQVADLAGMWGDLGVLGEPLLLGGGQRRSRLSRLLQVSMKRKRSPARRCSKATGGGEGTAAGHGSGAGKRVGGLRQESPQLQRPKAGDVTVVLR